MFPKVCLDQANMFGPFGAHINPFRHFWHMHRQILGYCGQLHLQLRLQYFFQSRLLPPNRFPNCS